MEESTRKNIPSKIKKKKWRIAPNCKLLESSKIKRVELHSCMRTLSSSTSAYCNI